MIIGAFSMIAWVGVLVLSLVRAEVVLHQNEQAGFLNPYHMGGSMMTETKNTFPAGLGEPVNVIISGNSDLRVLGDDILHGGIYNFLAGLGFGGQCFGLRMGNLQRLDTGDGRGLQNQEAILRHSYGDPYMGGCAESIHGGSHVRIWHQISTRAWFWSVSLEKNMVSNHDITLDGYDDGRDYMTALALGWPATNLQDFVPVEGDVYRGQTEHRGWTYETQVEYVAKVVSANKSEYNHYSTVQVIGRPVVDGLVAVYTVRVNGAAQLNHLAALLLSLVTSACTIMF